MTSIRPYPHSIIDQNFGLCITPEDLIFPFYYHSGSNYCRPWRWFKQTGNMDSGSSIDEANNILKITLDVQHFKPEEINVKVNDNEIIIEAYHEEKLDEHGFISRQFKRRYILPFEYSTDTVDCTLSSDGILILTAQKITKTIQTREIIVPIQICESSKKLDTNCTTNKHESDTKNLQSSAEKAAAKAHIVSNQIMSNENYTTKINESDVKTLESATKEILPMTFSKNNQTKIKEDHCRLLKPELLGAAVLEFKKSEELKEITEQVSATSKTSELAARSEACSEATSEMAETLLMESKEALSDNKYAGLGIISTISDHCQMTSDMKDINRISELSSALEEASATSLSTTENILQLVENMNVSGTSSNSQEIMEILETSSLKSSASAMSSQEVMEVTESKLKERMKISESLGKSSARSLGVSSTIEDMMDKCSAEIAEITNKYSDPGFMSASGTAKMQSMSYSSSEMQESSFSSSTTTASSESASILMSDVMAENFRK